MDKILLTAFLTALAGFITAALSIVKLVNEKESKTSEYRQSWTDSVREALSELIGNINARATLSVMNSHMFDTFVEWKKEKPEKDESQLMVDTRKEAIRIAQDKWSEGIAAVRELNQQIYQSYAHVRLHFKPDEPTFVRFENKFDICMALLAELNNLDDKDKRLQLKEKIHSAADEMTAISRGILKSEWETVKLGEPAYKSTKKWSIWICVVMLFVLLTIGVHSVISYSRGASTVTNLQPNSNSASTTTIK